MKLQIRLFVFLFSSSISLYSQDFHFSQFNETPELVNPALTGVSHLMRGTLIYRDQWKSVTKAYNTYGVSFETRFKPSNYELVNPKQSMTFKKTANRFAGGLSVYNDKAGDGNLSTLQSNMSFSMFFPLTKKSKIGFGLQGALTQRRVDNTTLIYPNQYNGTTYDSKLISGEEYTNKAFLYPEMASGITWSYGQEEKSMTANDEIKAVVGFSGYHLNRPKQNFLTGDKTRIYRKFIFHGNILIGIPNTMLALVPSWIAQFQGPTKEIVAGMLFKVYINDNSKYTGFKKRSAVLFGAYYRNRDALIASFMIDRGRYAIGFTYDVNSSSLITATKAKGGFEVSLRIAMANAYLYQKHAKKIRKKF